ncbi:MAG: thiamine-phosphate kinase [Candidatus Saganbacteria bacterium]|nr:thiamine-phosphate kinase [Candidatus Saganbacteria bacterium]
MKLSQLGEFGLIDLIKKLQKNVRSDTILGIGDDCAVLGMENRNWKMGNQFPISNSQFLLVTTDTLIEGVHFDLKHTSFFDLGYKAMMVNISDIAAMGGIPTHAVVTIGVSKNIQVKKLLQFQKGLNKLAKKYKIDIVGGDTVSSPKAVVVSITLLGQVEKKFILKRSGAKIGDQILVTGKFGKPAAHGYRLSAHSLLLSEAQKIAKSKLASAMIDSSDGLARSLSEICKASKVGVKLFEKNIPIAKGATLDHALYGGEEYELVFAVPKKNVNKIKKIVRCSVVGEIVSRGQGDKLKKGFEHFVK